ncbi:hypothetical protein NL676_034856 [Syzygium grande]|nr:hypothetical protein NL676_034856 [Syzygium grande]
MGSRTKGSLEQLEISDSSITESEKQSSRPSGNPQISDGFGSEEDFVLASTTPPLQTVLSRIATGKKDGVSGKERER